MKKINSILATAALFCISFNSKAQWSLGGANSNTAITSKFIFAAPSNADFPPNQLFGFEYGGTATPTQALFRIKTNKANGVGGNLFEVANGTTATARFLLNNKGEIVINNAGNAVIYTGLGTTELNRYLELYNSPSLASASGLRAGGILVADAYNYANPGKNDLIVKGNVGIGTSAPIDGLHVNKRGSYFGLFPANIGCSGNEYPSIGYNVMYSNTSGNTYTARANDAATLLRFGNGKIGSSAAFEFKAKESPSTSPLSQGQAITFTDLMTLLYNGNVGIGTSAPTYKLDVGSSTDYNQLRIKSTGTLGIPALKFAGSYNSGNGAQFSQDASGNFFFNINSSTSSMIIKNAGNGVVGIGYTSAQLNNIDNNYALSVNGNIKTKKVVVTNIATEWPDYVFEKEHKLMPLLELKEYINKNKHLPEIPAAQEVNKMGIDVGEMNAILLKKIEELTLYVIELKEENVKIKKALKQ